MKTIRAKVFYSPNHKTLVRFREAGKICEIYVYEGQRKCLGDNSDSYLRISIITTTEEIKVGDIIEFTR